MNLQSRPFIFGLFFALSLLLSVSAASQQENVSGKQQQSDNSPKTFDKNAAAKADLDSRKPAAPKSSSQQTGKGKIEEQDKIRLETKLVSLTLTVSDPYGRFVTGLTQENFEIFDNKVKQEIAIFTDEDAPITLGIIYDVSNSMSNLTTRSFAALKKFFHTSHKDDEYFIIAFNDKPQLIQNFTTSPDEILNRTVFIKAKGSTALYDAVYLAAEKAKQGRHPKKALLIISDGEDNNSRYSGKELSALLKESDVQIYAIGISELFAGAGLLKQIAGWTGGRAYFPLSDNEVGDIYTRMAILLRHQYVLGFYPTDTTSATQWHEVRLKITAPKGLGRLSLSYKKGYPSFNQ
jgi:Ca-activated chloride channel family protein